jgi:hypothetical protein
MKELFSEYGLKARLFPALLCVPPFLLLKHFAVDPFIDPSLTTLWVSAAGDVSLAAVLMYLLTQVNRFISKALFEVKSEFPTTLMLLPSSKDLSDEYRAKIDQRVRADFQLSLPTAADEQASLSNAKTRIVEIVSLIINKVGSGKLLLQHNIEYGFARNLLGGAIISLVTSVVSVAIFAWIVPSEAACITAVVLMAVYALPLIFSKPILAHYSKAYAPILFREYLGT